MKSWKLRYFTWWELPAIVLGAIITRFLKAIRYTTYYLPLKEKLRYIEDSGYKISRKGSLIVLRSIPLHDPGYIYFLRANSSDLDVFKQVMINKEYQLLYTTALNLFSEKDSLHIVDGGSNVGFTSLYFKDRFKNARIIGIEADKENWKMNKRNIQANNFEHSIIVKHNALWPTSDLALCIDKSFRDGREWSVTVNPPEPSKVALNSVRTMTLHDIIGSEFPERPEIDILKLDIEGAEATLLRDAIFLRCLSQQVFVMGIEIHEEFISKVEVECILTELGFEWKHCQETTVAVNIKLKKTNQT